MALEITKHFPRVKRKARLLSTETCVGIGMGFSQVSGGVVIIYHWVARTVKAKHI